MNARVKPRAASGRAHACSRAPLPARIARLWVIALLVLHVAFATWGAVRQSVTFDENFHLPAGVLEAARGELRVSAGNPPLVKALAGAAALAAGARVPADEAMGDGEQGRVGFAFMRANADRYQRVFVAGRLVTVLLSVLLALVVWRWARRLWGSRGALVALGFYALAPEALAHAGVVTMDVPTALGFAATLMGWQAFVRAGRARDFACTALALGFTFLVRFTAVFLPPLMLVLALAELAGRRVRDAKRVALGYVALGVTTLLLLNAGYLFRTSFTPLAQMPFASESFRSLAAKAPSLRLPIPDTYLMGFDRQAVESQAGHTPSYLLGTVHPDAPLAYFPVALAAKWPLGFLAALARRLVYAGARRPRARRMLWPLAGVALFLWIAMFVGRLGIGIRYVFPIVPLLAVALGALASGRRGDAAWWKQAAIALACVQGLEMAAHAPWHLSFYNALAGGPAKGQWIVNDSNVDWGQGLIALRAEMRARGITKVNLAYHGTADPSVYGISYVPYLGGQPSAESEWLAVSSYYFVGLSQRMTTSAGRTEQAITLDFRALWPREPEARPAGCMLLFRLR
ncbi:MAG: glycosyltransferase family 39 protein [Candidatus Eisenbacteria bacterium]|uniref:Glycosyltransferase family 39 protein n=1 Tax=Eiseniibacteriota bacterium TaxID=2212470 RepID=A0A933SF23_UNCEI|nr:glycosyltransferase family 39 protein [Candidatus Eisenbacteria bacterium]